MILPEDLFTPRGLLLLPKGREVKSSLFLHLQNYASGCAGLGMIKILVRAGVAT
jgi:hypothetical protein